MMRANEQNELWQGHQTFECPTSVLDYAGQTPALLAANLYMRAACVSIKAKSDYRLRFKSRTDSLCKKLHRTAPAVLSAFKVLEADGLLRRERTRDLMSKRWNTTEITLPFYASPTRSDVLTANSNRHSILIPQSALAALNKMGKSCQIAFYLSALFMATVQQKDRIKVSRSYLQRVSKLSRNAFATGLAYCRSKKLLSFRGDTLTLNDPLTGKSSHRAPLPVRMPVDFDAITADGWQKILTELLGGEFYIGDTGWSKRSNDRACPFCREPKMFCLNFQKACFTCFRCQEKGKLGTLVRRVLKVEKMHDAAIYMKKVLENTTAEVPVEV